MARAKKIRRELTKEEKMEAKRLRQAWDKRPASLGIVNQYQMAERCGMTQGAFSQYILGLIPLNIEALARFCRVLNCDFKAISPRLVKQWMQIDQETRVRDLIEQDRNRPVSLSSEERELLDAWRAAQDDVRGVCLRLLQHSTSLHGPSDGSRPSSPGTPPPEKESLITSPE